MLCIKEIADMTEIDDTYQYTEREGREQYILYVVVAGLTASTTRRIEAVFLNIYLELN